MTESQRLTSEQQKNINAALIDAAEKDCGTDTLATLVTLGAHIDAGTMTVLMHAVTEEDLDKAKFALENGASLNVQNKKNRNALMIAAKNGAKDIVDLLLAAGANLVSKDNHRKQASDFASENGYSDIAQYLEDIAAGKTQRPTPKEVGLDMNKRARRLYQR